VGYADGNVIDAETAIYGVIVETDADLSVLATFRG